MKVETDGIVVRQLAAAEAQTITYREPALGLHRGDQQQPVAAERHEESDALNDKMLDKLQALHVSDDPSVPWGYPSTFDAYGPDNDGRESSTWASSTMR